MTVVSRTVKQTMFLAFGTYTLYNIQYYCLSSNKNALIVPWIVLVAGHLADLIIEFNKDHLIKILSRCIGKEIIPRRRPTTCLPTSRPPARRMLTSSHTPVLLEVSILYIYMSIYTGPTTCLPTSRPPVRRMLTSSSHASPP